MARHTSTGEAAGPRRISPATRVASTDDAAVACRCAWVTTQSADARSVIGEVSPANTAPTATARASAAWPCEVDAPRYQGTPARWASTADWIAAPGTAACSTPGTAAR